MNPIQAIFAALCLALVAMHAAAAEPYTLNGRVVEVADGDTITLLVGIRSEERRVGKEC